MSAAVAIARVMLVSNGAACAHADRSGLLHHEAPATIAQKAEPAKVGRSRKTAQTIAIRARGFGPALKPVVCIASAPVPPPRNPRALIEKK